MERGVAAVGSGGFGRVAGCQRSCLLRCRGVICRSRSARRSRCCGRKVPACGRSRGGSGVRRRRSRASCAATRRRVAAGSTIARRPRSGKPSWARRPKPAKLADNERLREYVQERLCGRCAGRTGERWLVRGDRGRAGIRPRRQDRRWASAWSPEQISHRLKVDFPDDESMRISHEAIYQALYVQGRGALRRELIACLRTGRALRVPRARARRGKSFVTQRS